MAGLELYRITGTVVHHTSDEHCVSTDVVHQVPTFYLDANVHGIKNAEHAEKIAKDIVIPMELDYDSATIHLHAEKV